MTVEVHQATAATEKVVILEKKSSVGDFLAKTLITIAAICVLIFVVWYFFGDAILVESVYKTIG